MPLLPMLDMPGISPFVASNHAQALAPMTGVRAATHAADGQDHARAGQDFHEMFVASAADSSGAPSATLSAASAHDVIGAEQPAAMAKIQAQALLRLSNVPAAVTTDADTATAAPIPRATAWPQGTSPETSIVPAAKSSPVEVAALVLVAATGAKQIRVAPQPITPVRLARAKMSAAGISVIRNQLTSTASAVAAMPLAQSSMVVPVAPAMASITVPLPSASAENVTETVTKAAPVISDPVGPAVSTRSMTANLHVALKNVIAVRKAEPSDAALPSDINTLVPSGPNPALATPITPLESQGLADHTPVFPQDHEFAVAMPLVAQDTSTPARAEVAMPVFANPQSVIGGDARSSLREVSSQAAASPSFIPAFSTPASAPSFRASLAQTVSSILPEATGQVVTTPAQGQLVSPTIQLPVATAEPLELAAPILGSAPDIGILNTSALSSGVLNRQAPATPSGAVEMQPEPIATTVVPHVIADATDNISDAATADAIPRPMPEEFGAAATGAIHAANTTPIAAPPLEPTRSTPRPVTPAETTVAPTLSTPDLPAPTLFAPALAAPTLSAPSAAAEIIPRQGQPAARLPELVSEATPREPAAFVDLRTPAHVGFATKVIAGATNVVASDAAAVSGASSPALETAHVEPTTSDNVASGSNPAAAVATSRPPQAQALNAARAPQIDPTPQATTLMPSILAVPDASTVSVAVRERVTTPADLKAVALPSRSAQAMNSPQPAITLTPAQASVEGQPLATTRAMIEPATHSDVATALSGAANVGHAAASVVEPASVPHAVLQSLEIGVPGGTHGWLKVRAEMDSDGQVSASVVTTSASSGDSLRAQLPEMREFLGAEKVSVGSLAVHVAEPAITLAKGQTADLLQLSSSVAATAGAGAVASQTTFDNHRDSSATASMLSGKEDASAKDQASRRDGSGSPHQMTVLNAGIDVMTVDAQASLLPSMLVEPSGSRLSVRV